MEDRFKQIDVYSEKVHRIINAAFEVFAKNDFEKASTNNIVKQADVSRGLLYHYFKDKQELFDFLLEFSIEESMKNYDKSIDWDDTDMFDRYKITMCTKFELIRNYPYMMDFFTKYRSLLNNDDIRMRFETDYPGYREKFYYHNMDKINLKEGVDIEKMINILRWSIKGVTLEFSDKHNMESFDSDIDKLKAKCDTYIEFLRDQFYQ